MGDISIEEKTVPVDSSDSLSGAETVELAAWKVSRNPHKTEKAGSSYALWVHANGFAGQMWLPVIQALDEDVTVDSHIVFDLRGQGRSSKPKAVPENYAWDLQAEDALAVIRKMAGPAARVHGVGHSMGAAILVLAAARYPETFASLVLFEPIIMVPHRLGNLPAEQNPLIDRAMRRKATFENLEEARSRLGSKPPFSFFRPDVFEAYIEHGFRREEGKTVLACPPEIEAVNYLVGSRHGGYEALEKLQCPVLLAQGERSPKGGPLDASALVDRVIKARYVEIKNTTHFAPFENPERFAQVVADFWKSLPGGTSEPDASTAE